MMTMISQSAESTAIRGVQSPLILQNGLEKIFGSACMKTIICKIRRGKAVIFSNEEMKYLWTDEYSSLQIEIWKAGCEIKKVDQIWSNQEVDASAATFHRHTPFSNSMRVVVMKAESVQLRFEVRFDHVKTETVLHDKVSSDLFVASMCGAHYRYM